MAGYGSVFRGDLFRDRTVLVTGGGSGIGRCIAHELCALGAHVIISGRKRAKLEATHRELLDDGGRATFIAFDIRDEEAVRSSIREAIADTGPIHGLVNNAGGQFPAPLIAISQKGFETVVRTNLTGGFLVAREVFLQSMQEHGGAMVNIVADMWNGMPGMGHSGAARAGMVNLTKTAAFEWAPSHVRVNAVAPGWIASSGLDTYGEALQPVIRSLHRAVPLGRLGTEAEVSAAVCFLLSPAAAFINGVCIPVDGGAPLGNDLFPTGDPRPSPSFDGFHRAAAPRALGEDAGR
ncbi:MAG: SDR family oxidoreductase [Myxococcota bacterium]